MQVHCSHCLHGCGLHYNVLSGLSVKQEVKGEQKIAKLCTTHSLLANIGATVSEFRFFMRLRT